MGGEASQPKTALPVLKAQPAKPTGQVVMLECQGGSDKAADGHRRDTIPIANALIEEGWACETMYYSDATYDEVLAKLKSADAYIARINPGSYAGVTQAKLEQCLAAAAASGTVAMSHPNVMKKMGAKDALVKIRDLSCGMSDTYAYYDVASFKASFPKTVKSGTRVLKQNRGSQGEGIWVVRMLNPAETVTDATMLHCQEAVDNHVEERSLGEFMKFCEQYIEGADGQLIDQRFLPRIVEGELRVNMIYDTPIEIVHKKPAEGGISATLASGAKYVSYQPDDPVFKVLMDNFLNKDLPKIMPALGMDSEPIPLIWTSDFILGDKTASGDDTYFVGEFNCSCVGITQQLHLTPRVAKAAIRIVESQKAASATPSLPVLKAQPVSPAGKVVMLECQGGSDKAADGHRRDTIPIANALIEEGWSCETMYYSDATYDQVLAKLKSADAYIARINPGSYAGVTQAKLEQCLAAAAASGTVAMSHPNVMKKMGAKDALVKIRDLSCGMSDTYAYYDVASFKASFPKTVKSGTRVLKQNRGSQGEGIWVVRMLNPAETVTDATMLHCQEAVDNHVEERSLGEFMKFCEQYIEGADGQLIDQRFLPRIVEGELRVNMIYDTPIEIVHKKPAEGGISATLASGAKYVSYQPDDPVFKVLMDNFLNKDLPKIMPALGMDSEPIPLIWTSDFILGDKTASGDDTYFVGEFNCSCVGITQQLHLTPRVAKAAIRIVESQKAASATPSLPVLKAQPVSPAGKVVMLECQGGSDKAADGHRRDTIPIANALIEEGWSCETMYYSDATYDQVLAKLKSADAYIARINPGSYAGVTQAKLEQCLAAAAASGTVAMSHPNVMKKMGAKDALVKIRDLSCGMSDTYAYYDVASFKASFPKTVKSGTRVLKQNRGSQGEGIWVVRMLNPAETVTDATMLHCQEAVDNHVEERSLGEFMKFCEQYIEGADGQLIDQRFLPRIVEGELRVNMIYDTPIEIVHKKPAEGGISATLASGAKYVSYQPDDPVFKVLMDNFLNKDLPKIMPALGMDSEPIPLIWTSDFILGDKTASGDDTYFVGEFNCSCVGITQQLHLTPRVAKAAIRIVESQKAASATPSLPVLKAQPVSPAGKVVMLECQGGSDKAADGHRRDTIPIANALIEEGWSCETMYYSDATYDQVLAKLKSADAYIARINPGSYAGVTQAKLEQCLAAAAASGTVAMSHPNVMKKMGAKDALVKIRDLSCGMSDTYAYYDVASFKASFPKTVKSGTRVLKQNRGSQGEGIWVVRMLNPAETVTDATMLHCQEAVDNHVEERSLGEFMKFCEQYIEGADGQLIDQRFLPRIVEGELRVNMIYDTPIEIVHKKPAEGGISATLASGAKYVSYQPDDPVFKVLMDNFLNKDLPKIMPALGMDSEPIPLIWTSDFILGDKTASGDDTYFVGEFNCSCVGITQQLHLTPRVAKAAIRIVESQKAASATPSLPVLKAQPVSPAGKVVMLECQGGSDKAADGHRRDTIPIANALIEEGWSCETMYYSDATYDQVLAKLKSADAYIARINPGSYAGVTQAKLEQCLAAAAASGTVAMSHPNVMKKMGAKDALVKIRDLSCGMSDTYAYYDVASFKASFPKTVKSGTRVLKQNRGSQGEGIWVVRMLNPAETVTDATMLHCQEAVDNHVEERSLGEFMKFCEQYIEGADGQLIDQRFLPRIVEGELRVNMIYDTPIEIVHKKPAEGGISATLASGAKYVSYQPDDPVFKVLMDNFLNKDLPKIMPALGMDSEPIPLIWTSDFILGDKTASGDDTYFVGEFNCSCVGITQQLHLTPRVAKAAIRIVESQKAASATPSLPVLKAQPVSPAGKVVMLECQGGSDKAADGHRRDTIPIANALIEEGWSCETMYYSDATYDQVLAKLKSADAYIARINPGSYAGVTQAKLEQCLAAAAASGTVAMSHPNVMKKMGAKDALVKIRDLSCGMSDTYAYYDVASFKASFPKTVKSGTRVLKQNRGSQGEGIWVVRMLNPAETVTDATMLHCQEAVDNHVEERSLGEFMKFCEQYIEGADGQLIDQRFLPRIVEGELRVNMIYDTPIEIVHKKPAEGGISATLASGAKYVSYQPDDPVFKVLMDNFLNKDLPKIMPALGMDSEPIPLIWTSDFILGDKTASGDDTYFVGEFNCSCVGITQQLHLTPRVAKAAIRIVESQKAASATPSLPVLKAQPVSPAGKVVMLECQGGSDKAADGHRRDTIPIANALIEEGWSCETMYYSDATYDQVLAELKSADAYIARINPGSYAGVTQAKLEQCLAAAAASGTVAMSHPNVMKKMGAKDALVKIRDLSCGMSDTYAYYDVASFKASFPKTVKSGTRVLKQNRGSQGEGIWVVRMLNPAETVTDATMLHCQEAVDNHVEERSLGEFMKFCEQYIEGADGQLIDQRFLPRIVEGELRVNMIYDTPIEIVHKKPAEGGISATLASGAKYVSYQPDDPVFKVLMDNFLNKDLPKIMPALGMDSEPIPLIWTSDFILGDKTASGDDTYFVGEFNCSCVGITQQLHLTPRVAKAAIRIVESQKGSRASPSAPSLPVLNSQPANPRGKVVMLECQGGSDKAADGHRRDTIPIANALIAKGWACETMYYSDATYAQVLAKLKSADAYIARINPGSYAGVTQAKLEQCLAAAAASGTVAMSHPNVMKKMGAKDALVKIRDLSCGMSDTYAYYDVASFKASFPKTVKSGTRVLKQNRGSQGEGIWVVRMLNPAESVTDATMLHCQEAVDNHVEERSLGEFMKFCEQYIEGADGQLIDQRFLPRIVEGELRVNMIYDTPTEIVHKKPAAGGISATLASGAKYVSYQPDDPMFATLMANFRADLPKVMPALGMDSEPIPLIWTSDFILGDKTASGDDTYFVGEFNCSCVGITQQLHLTSVVADAATRIIDSQKAA